MTRVGRRTGRPRRAVGAIGLVGAVVVATVTGFGVGPATAQTAPTAPPPPGLGVESGPTVDRLEAASGAPVTYELDDDRHLTFVGAAPGRALAGPGGSSAATARGFVESISGALGLEHSRLETLNVQDTSAGEAVRLQQTIGGLPVVGGQLSVQLDASGAVRSVMADVSDGRSPGTTPGISGAAAVDQAVAATARAEGVDASELQAGAPVLSLYDPAVFAGGAPGLSLVWQVDVEAIDDATPVRELVLVDAATGAIALKFNQIAFARDREVCDDNNVAQSADHCTAGTAVRHESGSPSANGQVEAAFVYSGDTYDFFKNRYNRDSLNNAGMTLYSTVQYCDPGETCPYANAFWSGSQMHYGDTYASGDDVVGHELTHGVTTFTSNLYYYFQSGAINEALSDIFGEYIDLTNGKGTDTAGVRWSMGEDLPIGAIRNMANPPAFNDPDKMTSTLYINNINDSGGVHTNSGVANKAAFLMTDGQTFNGQTVTGIGIDKAAAIWYRVETAYLLSGSDYANLGTALNAACGDLIGGTWSITAGDCTNVSKAVLATEMAERPPTSSDPGPEAPVCTSGSPTYLFHDDLENSASGNWTTTTTGNGTAFYYPQGTNPYGRDDTYATSGTTHFWGIGQSTVGESTIATTNAIAIPAASSAFLRFNRAFEFDNENGTNYDGGVVEYSTTNGSSWTDAGPLFTHGGYGGTIVNGTGNPLAGRSAFVKLSNGYGSSRIDLSSLAGQNVKFRFREGTDDAVISYGWWIDDIDLFTCGAPPANGFLRVTTTPAVASMITVDGVERDEYGLNWVSFPNGSHEVCFGEVPGFVAPPCQTVAVDGGATTTVNGTFTALGYLRVLTSPALPSTITVEGTPVNEYGAWLPAIPGNHEVCFGAVKDFTTPTCRMVAVTAGATASTTGTFVANAGAPGPDPGYGLLRVTTNPAVGASIVVDGFDRDQWGLNWLKIEPGSHEVCFGAVYGAGAPGCQTVNVTAGNTTTVTGNYTLKGAIRAITSPAVNAAISIDGQVANNYGAWRTISVGSHTVCFGGVTGYSTPACRDVTVSAGATASTTGTYNPL